MADASAETFLTPERRAALYMSTLFFGAGSAGAYFGIWLSNKGISAGDIGLINSAPVLVMLILNIAVGRIADRASDWRGVIVLGTIITALSTLGLLRADGFWGILLVWTLCTVPGTIVSPVAEAATMRMTRRRGSSYSGIRAWGTVGYMFALGATGYVVTVFGPGAFVPFFCLLALSRAVTALFLPRFRAPEGVRVAAPPLQATHLKQVMKPWFVLAITAFGVVQGTHFILNAFGALAWKDAGISEAVIGPLLALGALSEAVMMFAFARFAKRFPARYFILASALVAAMRWSIMAFNPPVAVLAVLQLTHSITFGLGYLGVVNFVANWTSEDVAAEAQSFAVVVQQGMSVLAMVGFGFLFERIGIHVFWVAGGFAFLGAAMVTVSLLLTTPKPTMENSLAELRGR